MVRRLFLLLALLAVPLSLRADPALLADEIEVPYSRATAFGFLLNYVSLGYALNADAYRGALELRDTLATFVAEPTDEGLAAVRHAWAAAHLAYARTEVFRFYGSPIDFLGYEPLINGWPLDPARLDVVPGGDGGFIGQPERYPFVSARLLQALHQREDPTQIMTGWHALEFLLWGLDTRTDGPGERPLSDFTTDPFAERRREYLIVAASLLADQIQAVMHQWEQDSYDNYAGDFLNSRPHQLLAQVFTGIHTLAATEVAENRLAKAREQGVEAAEEAPFSDLTSQVIQANLEGMAAVLTGDYTSSLGRETSGPGLVELVASVDPALADDLRTTLATAQERAAGLPEPFDAGMMAPPDDPRHAAIATAEQSFTALAAALTQSRAALGLPATDVGD